MVEWLTALEKCMSQSNNVPVGGQFPPGPENLDISLEGGSSIISLSGLADLLSALEFEIGSLPSPYPLFARELEAGISASLEVAE